MTAAVSLPDLDLVELAQQGDRRAFDELVRRQWHYVLALARRHVGDPIEAEDVTQEVFLRAWRGLGRFRGQAEVRTWLHRITIRAAITYRMSVRGRQRYALLDESVPEHAAALATQQDLRTPEACLLADELHAVIVAAIACLPPEQRQAITLCEIELLTYEEIAERQDVPIGTVRSRIFRARDAIERALP